MADNYLDNAVYECLRAVARVAAAKGDAGEPLTGRTSYWALAGVMETLASDAAFRKAVAEEMRKAP